MWKRNFTICLFKYQYNNRKDPVRVYCCVDTERQKRTATPFDLPLIHKAVQDRNLVQVLSVDAILAKPELESWFFYDIEGIYGFLRAKTTSRNTKKYSNPHNFGKKDLQRLFQRFGKEYKPGRRAKNFIDNLDIEAIVSRCAELKAGVEAIKTQAQDRTSYLFLSG